MGSICFEIFAQISLFTFWSLLFLEKSGSAVRPLCWESWDDSILCNFIHCCYFHYCIWVPDLKNRVTVFSSVKWQHKCVAEFLWELQRCCPDCCLSLEQSLSSSLEILLSNPTVGEWACPPLFHHTVMAISQGSSAMARFLQQEEERERMNKVLGQQTRNSNALRIPCGKQNFRWRTLPRNHDCLQSCLLLLGSLGLERKLAEQKSSKSSRDGHKKRTDYVLLY